VNSPKEKCEELVCILLLARRDATRPKALSEASPTGFYSALVGRFKSADAYRPSGNLVDPQSWNRYAYTPNDPGNRTDGDGLADTEGHLAPMQNGEEEDGGGGGGGDPVLHSCPPRYHHEDGSYEDCVKDQAAETPPFTSPGAGSTGGLGMGWGGLGGDSGEGEPDPRNKTRRLDESTASPLSGGIPEHDPGLGQPASGWHSRPRTSIC
jgi:hypothetical protein